MEAIQRPCTHALDVKGAKVRYSTMSFPAHGMQKQRPREIGASPRRAKAIILNRRSADMPVSGGLGIGKLLL